MNPAQRQTYLLRFYGALTGMIDAARAEGRGEEVELLVKLDRQVGETLEALKREDERLVAYKAIAADPDHRESTEELSKLAEDEGWI